MLGEQDRTEENRRDKDQALIDKEERGEKNSGQKEVGAGQTGGRATQPVNVMQKNRGQKQSVGIGPGNQTLFKGGGVKMPDQNDQRHRLKTRFQHALTSAPHQIVAESQEGLFSRGKHTRGQNKMVSSLRRRGKEGKCSESLPELGSGKGLRARVKRAISRSVPGFVDGLARFALGLDPPRAFGEGAFLMAGVGKLLKQAQKMQRQIDELQKELADHVLDVSSGGGAVQIKITADGTFKALTLDEEFLKEDKELIEESLLAAVQEAAEKAKAFHAEEMQKVTAGFQMPGFM